MGARGNGSRGHGWGLDELAVGGVGPAVAVGLEVGEQQLQSGELAADSAARLTGGGELLPPGDDVLGADGGEGKWRLRSKTGSGRSRCQPLVGAWYQGKSDKLLEFICNPSACLSELPLACIH